MDDDTMYKWFHRTIAALHYDDPPQYYRRSVSRYARVLELASNYVDFSEQIYVAEIGVGMLLPMVKVNTACPVTGYGLAEDTIWDDLEMLGVDLFEWDLHQKIPYEYMDTTHDLVFFCEVIEHICRFPIEILTDIGHLIKPGGYLILTTVNLMRASNRWRMLRGESPLINPFERTRDGRYHIREFTLQELVGYIGKAGYRVLEKEYWSMYHDPIVAGLLRPLEKIIPSLRNYIAIVAQKIHV